MEAILVVVTVGAGASPSDAMPCAAFPRVRNGFSERGDGGIRF